MANPAAGVTYILKLLGLLGKKKSEADAVAAGVKSKAKLISGVPYLPTGFENTSFEDLIKEINSSFEIVAGKVEVLPPGQSTDLNVDMFADADAIPLSSSISSIEDVPITACPTDKIVVPKPYTKEEIEKVIKDAAEECETRETPSNLLKGIDLQEAVEAKCDITPPPTPEIPEFLETVEPSLLPQTEPEGALKKPKKTIVVLENIKMVKEAGQKGPYVKVTPLKQIGETVNCGDPVMTVGTKTLTCPIKQGIIKNILTEKAKKGDKLFTVESTGDDDLVEKTLQAVEELTKKISQLTSLKEELGRIEPVVWVLKQIYGIYEGQLQGYVAYYNTFSTLSAKRDNLRQEFNDNIKKLRKIYEDRNGIDANYVVSKNTIAFKGISVPKIYADLYKRQEEIINELADVTAQIDVVRSEQPVYFAIDKSSEANAAIVKKEALNDYNNYKFIPFKLADKIAPTPNKDLLQGLANTISPFTNNILINKKQSKSWKSDNQDINALNIINAAPLSKVETAIYDFYFYASVFDFEFWTGELRNVRADFISRAQNFGNTIKEDSDPDEITQSCNDLRNDERTLPATVEALANSYYDKVVAFCKNFGYAQINKTSIFIEGGTNVESELTSRRDTAKTKFEEQYNRYVQIRTEIDSIEKEIDVFPDNLKKTLESDCILPESSDPSASTINGEKVSLIKWPVGQFSLPTEDINYKKVSSPGSPPITSLSYWRKYCKLATVVNLLPLYWPVGLLIPTPGPLIKIPLPIIWTPLAVVPNPLCMIVIGIALCGICPAPFVYLVNPGQPFPIGLAASKASWHIAGIRGPKKIDDDTASKVLAAIPSVTVPIKSVENGQQKTTPLTIDVAPKITAMLPFAQDDLPAYERLSLGNLPYLAYLGKWCSAGKKTMGFFENP